MKDPWVDDQLDAASKEARTMLLTVIKDSLHANQAHFDAPVGDHPKSDEVIERFMDLFFAGKTRWCKHLVEVFPQPMYAEAYRDLVSCFSCFRVAQTMTSQTEEDDMCDCCRKACPDGLWPTAILKGPLTITFGLCDDCAAEDNRPLGGGGR